MWMALNFLMWMTTTIVLSQKTQSLPDLAQSQMMNQVSEISACFTFALTSRYVSEDMHFDVSSDVVPVADCYLTTNKL